jgi:hypothetical protein
VPQSSDKPTVLFLLGVMAFAIILVDDRWMRVGLGLLPALLLAQRALGAAGVRAPGSTRTPAEIEADRRRDPTLRQRVEDLLALIREFYTTCHMVAVGQLEASKAKAKAQEVEAKLNTMMADMIEQVEAMAPSE